MTAGPASGLRGRFGFAAAVVLLSLATALDACSSTPPTLYTIAPVPGQAQTGAPTVIVLREIALARYLQRSQIVHSSENYRLDVMSNDWWGEPLSAMLGRVMADELRQRLPGSSVVSESGAVSVPGDATLEINIERLDQDASGSVVLQAQAAVDFKGQSTPRPHSFRLVVPSSSSGTIGEVAAISTAVGQLADGLAAILTEAPARR